MRELIINTCLENSALKPTVENLIHALQVYEVNPCAQTLSEASALATQTLIILGCYSCVESLMALQREGWSVVVDHCVCYPTVEFIGRIIGKNYSISYGNAHGRSNASVCGSDRRS